MQATSEVILHWTRSWFEGKTDGLEATARSTADLSMRRGCARQSEQ